MARRPFAVAIAAVAVGAAIWATVGSAWLLPELTANSDEGVYLLQADALASGHLAPPAPATDADAYLPWFSVVDGDRYVLKYTPVHAAVIAAADRATSTPRAALAVIAAAQVVLVAAFARELGAGRAAALVATCVFATSPLVVQLSLTYLPYGTSLALELAAVVAALRAVRTRHRWTAAGAGLALGTAAFARPYDAVLVGIALAVALLVRERHRLRSLLAMFPAAAAGAALPVVALLLYNRAMTGDPLRLPFLLLEPADRPGLGLRRALPTDPMLDFTPGRAAAALGRSLLLVIAWTAGGALTAALAAATLVRRRLRATAAPVALLLVWPAGYALFWGSYVATVVWGGALFLGPYYHLPMVAVLAVAGGIGLTDLWSWRPGVATATVVGMALLSVPVLVPALEEQADRSASREVVADLVDSRAEAPALVFLPPVYGPYLQNPFSFLRNRPDLGGPVVYALDGDAARNERVLDAHPGRTAYRVVLDDGWSDDPGYAPAVRLVRLPPSNG